MRYEPRHRAPRRPARRLRLSMLSTTVATMALTTATGTGSAFGATDVSTRPPNPLGPVYPVPSSTPVQPIWDDPVVVTSSRGTYDVARVAWRGRADQILDMPGAALAAYQRAEAVMDEAAPGCRLHWTLLAAVGRVLTDHGQRGAHRVDDEGGVKPGIVGRHLRARDGSRISDTDAGLLDEDRRFDRPVGPMLLSPTDWSVLGVDGDGDRKRNPQDLDDATLALAVLLCARGEDLRTDEGKRAALRRVDATPGFVRAVLAVERDYREQVRSGVEPVVPVASVPLTAVPALPTRPQPKPADRAPEPDPATDAGFAPGAHTADPGGASHQVDPGDVPQPPAEPEPAPERTPEPAPTSEQETEPEPEAEPEPESGTELVPDAEATEPASEASTEPEIVAAD